MSATPRPGDPAITPALIAEHGLRLGLEPDLTVLTDARRHQLVVRVLRSVEASAGPGGGAPAKRREAG